MRVLRRSLEEGFEDRGMQRGELVAELLRSPALVGRLEGVEAEVARRGYIEALQMVWFSAAAVAGVAIFVQAAVGRKGATEVGEEGESVDGVEA